MINWKKSVYFPGGCGLYKNKQTRTINKQKFLKEAKSELSWMFEMMRVYYGNGLITSDGAKWKERRSMLNPLFNSAFVNRNYDLFNEKIDRWLEGLNASEPFDVYEQLKRLTLKVVLGIYLIGQREIACSI